MFIQSKISYIRQWTHQFLKIYYIQYNVFNNNEHNILHISESVHRYTVTIIEPIV